MSIINLFLQKRKMHESRHGIIMVITAYALSVFMLIMGSDMFYNINSEAAGINKETNEETQKKINKELPVLQTADLTVFLIQSKLQNPFGIAEITQTGLGSTQAEESKEQQNAVLTQEPEEDLLISHAVNSQRYENAVQQSSEINSVTNIIGTQAVSERSKENGQAKETTKVAKGEKSKGTAKKTSSKEEIVSLSTETSNPYVFDVTKDEVKMLERIVQAEAGGEDMRGKILIVNVILNRVADDHFPDNVKDVIFQNKDGEYQFSPVEDERYWSVEISDNTEEAVQRALEGEDYSDGALYFIARKRTTVSSAAWFDNNLTWLFKHGGHEFYK